MSLHTQPADFTIPPDESERTDHYDEMAREKLLADGDWLAAQIAESVDALTAKLLMDTEYDREDVRDHVVCKRLRAAVNAAIEREVPDLAESLWMRDVEESHQAAAEYSADCRED